MKFAVAACLIVTMTSLDARAQAPAHSESRPPPDTPLRARLTDEVIKDAVKQSLASEKQDAVMAPDKALSADRYRQFGREMSDAKIPDCLHGDALKFQPTLFGGLLAIPFWAIAAIRGKCR
ncbi:MAG: hypothetical protein ACXWC4_14595 [Telluria sp.]